MGRQTPNKSSVCLKMRSEGNGGECGELLAWSTEAGDSPGEITVTLEEEAQVSPKSMGKPFLEGGCLHTGPEEKEIPACSEN